MADAFHFGLVNGPCWMGIVNVTPDSFSDTGQFAEAGAAIAHGRELAAAGGRILDVGAEASSFFRPGVVAVGAEEQWRRLEPVLGGLRELREGGVAISVDSRSAEVARRALEAGAGMVNDISAGTHDAAMLETVARAGGAIVLMHISACYPATPGADDPDIVGTVREYLAGRVEAAVRAGMGRERIAVDPGIGFGKTMRDNWMLALRAGELAGLGAAVVLGASRKRFLETAPPALPEEAGREWGELLARYAGRGWRHSRDAATAAVTRMAMERGVRIHRVHDVAGVRGAVVG